MTDLKDYLRDGAHAQPQAVLALIYPEIDDSYDTELHCCTATVKVARWENCREQGYVVMLKSDNYSRQLNIAFFEHRNSDAICAVKWEQRTINAPTIDTAEFGNVYKDKWDVSHETGPGEIQEMATWINRQFEDFYKETSKAQPAKSK